MTVCKIYPGGKYLRGYGRQYKNIVARQFPELPPEIFFVNHPEEHSTLRLAYISYKQLNPMPT